MWTYVERAASLATIFAFLAAVYAIIFPATVSDFLSEISESNARLADEIPYWITLNGDVDERVLGKVEDASGGAVFAVPLKNEGNFTIEDVTVRVGDIEGRSLFERTGILLSPFGTYTIYAEAPSGSFDDGMTICISGYSTRAKKRLFELRALRPEGIAGVNTMYTTGYEFTDTDWPEKCR